MQVICEYPGHLADDIGKAYIDGMAKYPDDRSIAKPIIKACVNSKIPGITVIAIWQIKEGKTKEALDLASNRMLLFAKNKGFKYSIDICYDAIEAMGLLGMEAP